MSEEYFTRETLLLKLKNRHDEEAWVDFINTYKRYIKAVLRNMNLNSADIDDISQSVLLQAWKKLPDFEYEPGKGRFRSWLARVTANTALNFIRQEGRLKKTLNSEKSYKLDDYTEIDLTPEIELISKREWQDFIAEKAWENISADLSEKVRLCFEGLLKGRTVGDIAQDVGINENTVYVYKKRVQNKMCAEVVRLERELG
jgi:RNA polymerase sigma factor (sigma-70 family)